MKRLSQTIKISIALVMAVFANNALPVSAAAMIDDMATEETTVLATPSEETETLVPVAQADDGALQQVEPLMSLFGGPGGSRPPHEDTVVTPTKPVVNDACGTAGDTYTIPTIEGVSYYRGQTQLTNGQTYSTQGDSSVTITARAKNNYVFPGNQTSETWRLEFSTKCTICHRTASVGNPYVSITVDQDAVDGNSRNDHGKGDHYLVHTGPLFPGTGSDGKWGDIIPAIPGVHGGRNWDAAGQAIYNNDCAVPVEVTVVTGPCAYFDTTSYLMITVTGTAKDSRLVVYNALNQQVYSSLINVDKDGEIVAPAFPVTVAQLPAGSYRVEVQTKHGQTVLDSAQVTIEQCLYTVTPTAPHAYDFCYSDKDYVKIPRTDGAFYTVDGVEQSGRVSYDGGSLVVVAEALPGYQFPEGAVTSWTFDDNDFTDEQCLTIQKTGKVASDTSRDGIIGVGDTVTWVITVTNTSENDCEDFYVTVEDLGVTLENDGHIGRLGAGESISLTATSVLTVQDMNACKALNTATFFAWRQHGWRGEATMFNEVIDDESDWLVSGDAVAVYTLTCPTPGSGSGVVGGTGVSTTATPKVLPATGGDARGDLLSAVLIGVVAYGATSFLRRRTI